MLQKEQIEVLIQDAVKAYKEKLRNDKLKELPDYNPIYKLSVKYDAQVAVHAEGDDFPEELFREKAPNESDVERAYRKGSYQPETAPLWNSGLNQTNRILNEQNYSITWEDESDEDPDRPSLYFTKQYPSYGNFFSGYTDAVVRPYKINYANALMCFKPRDLPYKEVDTESGKDRDYSFDDTRLIEPVSVIYPSKQVIRYKDGQYALILLNEKSWVTHGSDKPVKEGLVFELYDTDVIYRIEQYGKKTEYTFQTFTYYQHDLGILPATKLKGKPKEIDGEIVFKSHFHDAVPSLNQALYDSSTLQVSKVAHVFLQKWEYFVQCDSCGGKGKIEFYEKVSEAEDRLEHHTCNVCNGSGKMRTGPLGVTQIAVANQLGQGANIPTPPAGYVEMDHTILTFLREDIKYNERKSFKFLGVDVSETEAKGAETALGKIIDRDALFSALQIIAKELFDLIEFSVEVIGRMRYGDSFKPPHINRPTNFTIRQPEDLTKEISEAINAQLPEVVLRELLNEYLKTRFSNNADKTQLADLVFAADDLQMMPTAEIATRLGQGTIAKWQDVLHVNIYRFIAELLAEDEKWMEKETTEKVADLQAKAKTMASEIQPKAGTVDDLLASSTEEAE